jgi:MYXO-CTERM domain-containing protein
MVCYGQTTQQCAPRSEHEPADNDVDGGESRCPPGILHSCVPRYVPPCTKAADCGDGFTCEETVALSCGASSLDAAAGSSDAGSTAQCTSMRTGQFRCQLEEHACSGTSECPAGYACAANPALASCTSASVSGEDGGAQATAASACSSMPAHVCLPPYYGLDFAAGVAEQNTFILTGRGLPERRGGMGGCAVAMGPAAAGGPLPGLGWLAPLVVLALGRRARRR